MTDNTQPDAREFTMSQYASKDCMIGAMPDLSQLTERGAVAWAGVDAQGLREGRWYMVNKDGMATLCADQADAEQSAQDAQAVWSHMGPHRAVQLVEAGHESAAANAGGEPVAINREALIDAITQGLHDTWHCTRVWDAWHVGTMSQDDFEPVDESDTPAELADAVLALLPTHPSPPEGMVGGWMPIETAPKDGTAIDLWRVGGGREPCAVWGLPPHCCGEMGRLCDSDWHDYQQGWVTDWFDEPEPDSEFTHWMHLPPQPTTSAGSGKGE